MAHKTLIGGTAYEVSGGKPLVNGTAYSIKNGKTLVGGTAYEVGFAPAVANLTVETINTDEDWENDAYVEIYAELKGYGGQVENPCRLYDGYYTTKNYEVPVGTKIVCDTNDRKSTGCSYISVNGVKVATIPYTYTVVGDVKILVTDGETTGSYGIIEITEY